MERNFRQVQAGEFRAFFYTGEYMLLDVRTPGELNLYGKISDNQLLIDISNQNFVTEIGKLDPDKKYLLYCWHGNRSVVARNYMEKQGFRNVIDLAGGIEAWNALI